MPGLMRLYSVDDSHAYFETVGDPKDQMALSVDDWFRFLGRAEYICDNDDRPVPADGPAAMCGDS